MHGRANEASSPQQRLWGKNLLNFSHDSASVDRQSGNPDFCPDEMEQLEKSLSLWADETKKKEKKEADHMYTQTHMLDGQVQTNTA